MKIVIDAGHGGHDPGAINLEAGVEEKNLNLQYAIALQSWLEGMGHTVRMVRDSDHFVPLVERTARANQEIPPADAFISIHCNAAGNQSAVGAEIWTSPGKTSADSLASFIGNAITANCNTTPFRRDDSDGDLDKEGRLYVLIHTNCPAVLIEVGFISNTPEANRLKDTATIQNMAHAIALGVASWASA